MCPWSRSLSFSHNLFKHFILAVWNNCYINWSSESCLYRITSNKPVQCIISLIIFWLLTTDGRRFIMHQVIKSAPLEKHFLLDYADYTFYLVSVFVRNKRVINRQRKYNLWLLNKKEVGTVIILIVFVLWKQIIRLGVNMSSVVGCVVFQSPKMIYNAIEENSKWCKPKILLHRIYAVKNALSWKGPHITADTNIQTTLLLPWGTLFVLFDFNWVHRGSTEACIFELPDKKVFKHVGWVSQAYRINKR